MTPTTSAAAGGRRPVVLVTGAGRGIGRAVADRMLRDGYHVVYSDARVDSLGDVVPSDSADRVELDVTSELDWKRVLVHLAATCGHVDVLVNNAGIDMMKPIDTIELAEWRRLMEVNVDGVFLGVRAVLPMLRSSAPDRHGGAAIVNLSSILGQTGMADVSAYSASKGAVTVLTKSLALELAPSGIRVNSVHPGFIDGPMLRHGSARAVEDGRFASEEEFVQSLVGRAPLGRVGTADDVAAAVAFLASADAAYITGCELNVDGGYAAG